MDTKSLIKRTEAYQYLHRSSNHPTSVFKGFIKGESLSHFTVNSDHFILESMLKLFETILIDRGYSTKEIQKSINDSTKRLEKNRSKK